MYESKVFWFLTMGDICQLITSQHVLLLRKVDLDIGWNKIQQTYRKLKEKHLAQKDQNIDAFAKLEVGMLGKTMEYMKSVTCFLG